MKQPLASVLLGAAILVILSGCGRTATPESIAKDKLAQFNELATVLENAKSIDDVKPKIDAILAKFSDLEKQAEALKIPEAKQKEMQASLKAEMTKTAGRMMAAMMKLAVSDPKGIEKLHDSMQKFAIGK